MRSRRKIFFDIQGHDGLRRFKVQGLGSTLKLTSSQMFQNVTVVQEAALSSTEGFNHFPSTALCCAQDGRSVQG
jgi:hypothetical protein